MLVILKVEEKTNSQKKYRKVNDIMPTQLLFSKFFNEDNEKKPGNMIYNHKSSYYELLSD